MNSIPSFFLEMCFVLFCFGGGGENGKKAVNRTAFIPPLSIFECLLWSVSVLEAGMEQ